MVWKNDTNTYLTGDWVASFVCIRCGMRNLNSMDIAARWRRTLTARRKQGEIHIMPVRTLFAAVWVPLWLKILTEI